MKKVDMNKRAYRESSLRLHEEALPRWDCMRHYEIVASGDGFFDEDPTTSAVLELAFWPQIREGRRWPVLSIRNGTVDGWLDASGASA